MIFTGGSIHQLHLASGGGATRVDDLNRGRGVLATNCVAEFNGQLFVVDRNDVYVTSGSGQTRSVIDEKMKSYFFNNLNPAHYTNTFVVNNLAEDEIWVCYPTQTSTGACNEALIYNYLQDTWTIRDLPNSFAATNGPTTNGTSFDLNTDFLVVTGQRVNATDEEQVVTASGAGSNQEQEGREAVYHWNMSGLGNTHVDSEAEVHTITLGNTNVRNYGYSTSEVQTATQSGTRSNVFDPELIVGSQEILSVSLPDGFEGASASGSKLGTGLIMNFDNRSSLPTGGLLAAHNLNISSISYENPNTQWTRLSSGRMRFDGTTGRYNISAAGSVTVGNRTSNGYVAWGMLEYTSSSDTVGEVVFGDYSDQVTANGTYNLLFNPTVYTTLTNGREYGFGVYAAFGLNSSATTSNFSLAFSISGILMQCAIT